jgi:hypothetical protein
MVNDAPCHCEAAQRKIMEPGPAGARIAIFNRHIRYPGVDDNKRHSLRLHQNGVISTPSKGFL